MKLLMTTNGFCLILMIGFLAMAFTTKDAMFGQLFAALGIINGAVAHKSLSTQNIADD